MSMSDRIMVMEGGRIQQIGTPQEIYNYPSNHFVASFIGESNILEGTIKEVDNKHVIVDVGNDILLKGLRENSVSTVDFTKGKKVLLSIRPEFIEIGEGPNLLNGEIQFSEFTGVNTNYIVRVGNIELNVMNVNKGLNVLSRGDAITLNIPEKGIYFMHEKR